MTQKISEKNIQTSNWRSYSMVSCKALPKRIDKINILNASIEAMHKHQKINHKIGFY